MLVGILPSGVVPFSGPTFSQGDSMTILVPKDAVHDGDSVINQVEKLIATPSAVRSITLLGEGKDAKAYHHLEFPLPQEAAKKLTPQLEALGCKVS